jgi:5-methylcytosine-specific restriction endonuclease McrA
VACFYCGTILDVENLSADHRHPSSKEGKDTEVNLRLICKMCNTTKSDFSEEQFLGLLKTAREYSCEKLLRSKLRASNLMFRGRK